MVRIEPNIIKKLPRGEWRSSTAYRYHDTHSSALCLQSHILERPPPNPPLLQLIIPCQIQPMKVLLDGDEAERKVRLLLLGQYQLALWLAVAGPLVLELLDALVNAPGPVPHGPVGGRGQVPRPLVGRAAPERRRLDPGRFATARDLVRRSPARVPDHVEEPADGPDSLGVILILQDEIKSLLENSQRSRRSPI